MAFGTESEQYICVGLKRYFWTNGWPRCVRAASKCTESCISFVTRGPNRDPFGEKDDSRNKNHRRRDNTAVNAVRLKKNPSYYLLENSCWRDEILILGSILQFPHRSSHH